MIGDLMQRSLTAVRLRGNACAVFALVLLLFAALGVCGASSAVAESAKQQAASGDNTADDESAPDVADESDEPDAEELYDRFIEAIGGKKAVSDIETAHTRSTVLAGNQQLTLETKWHCDGAFTIEYSMAGVVNRAGSDGVIGWQFNSAGGYRLIPSAALFSVYDRSTYPTMLISLPQRYDTMRLIGRDTFNKRAAYRVELTDHDGKTRLAFYDRETNLILGLRWTEQAPIGDLTVEMLFENWKEYGDIRSWSRLVLTKLNTIQTIDIDEMVFNEVSPATFMLPEEVKDLVAEQATAPPSEPKPAEPPSTPAKP